MGLEALVEWSSQERDREADKLASSEFSSSDPALQLSVDASKLLLEALQMGREAESAVERQRRETPLDRCRKLRRRRPEDRLRITDTW